MSNEDDATDRSRRDSGAIQTKPNMGGLIFIKVSDIFSVEGVPLVSKKEKRKKNINF